MVIQIVILDAEVQVAPKLWLSDRNIKKYYNKHHRMPLINGSDHQHMIKQEKTKWRQSRPDILHFGLLLALNLAKNADSEVQVYFSISNQIYQIDSQTNIPRAQNRFYAILEILLQTNKQNPFIKKINTTWDSLLVKQRIAFSKRGKNYFSYDNLDEVAVIYGGNAHGSVNFNVIPNVQIYKISEHSLELWSALALTLPQILQY